MKEQRGRCTGTDLHSTAKCCVQSWPLVLQDLRVRMYHSPETHVWIRGLAYPDVCLEGHTATCFWLLEGRTLDKITIIYQQTFAKQTSATCAQFMCPRNRKRSSLEGNNVEFVSVEDSNHSAHTSEMQHRRRHWCSNTISTDNNSEVSNLKKTQSSAEHGDDRENWNTGSTDTKQQTGQTIHRLQICV